MSKKRERKYRLYDYDKQLAKAFKQDCEHFLEEFGQLQSFNFTDFAKLWQEKNFTFVYAGHQYALLLKEFCENIFYIVKKFIVFPRNIYTQLGAFYLLYGLYYKQPLRQWVKIRLTFEEYKAISDLIQLLKEQKHLDALYIFSKMKVEQAFLYVAQRKPLGPEERFVKSYEVYLDDTFNSYKSESAMRKFKELLETDVINKLEGVNNDYQKQLKEYSDSCPSLSTFTSTIIQDFNKAYLKFNRKVTMSTEDKEDTLIERRKSLRDKVVANKNAVYRGCRTVKTALDEDINAYSDDDE